MVETVRAVGGFSFVSVTWLRRLSDLAARGILLIIDDIRLAAAEPACFSVSSEPAFGPISFAFPHPLVEAG
jgi:hypothetical protein